MKILLSRRNGSVANGPQQKQFFHFLLFIKLNGFFRCRLPMLGSASQVGTAVWLSCWFLMGFHHHMAQVPMSSQSLSPMGAPMQTVCTLAQIWETIYLVNDASVSFSYSLLIPNVKTAWIMLWGSWWFLMQVPMSTQSMSSKVVPPQACFAFLRFIWDWTAMKRWKGWTRLGCRFLGSWL